MERSIAGEREDEEDGMDGVLYLVVWGVWWRCGGKDGDGDIDGDGDRDEENLAHGAYVVLLYDDGRTRVI